MKYLILVSLNS